MFAYNIRGKRWPIWPSLYSVTVSQSSQYLFQPFCFRACSLSLFILLIYIMMNLESVTQTRWWKSSCCLRTSTPLRRHGLNFHTARFLDAIPNHPRSTSIHFLKLLRTRSCIATRTTIILRLDEGCWSCDLAMYHQHSNAPSWGLLLRRRVGWF